jgi:hypothetical protein
MQLTLEEGRRSRMEGLGAKRWCTDAGDEEVDEGQPAPAMVMAVHRMASEWLERALSGWRGWTVTERDA